MCENKAFPTSVNSQVTDAVTQGNLHLHMADKIAMQNEMIEFLQQRVIAQENIILKLLARPIIISE
jgi:hypothetical protein